MISVSVEVMLVILESFLSGIFYTLLLSIKSLSHHPPPHFSGKHGIICLEDLIHEIYSVGKGFRVANNFLLPFKLSVARHAARDKAGLLKDLGNPGFRDTDINSIIRQLNWGRWTWSSNFKDALFVEEQMSRMTKYLYLFFWQRSLWVSASHIYLCTHSLVTLTAHWGTSEGPEVDYLALSMLFFYFALMFQKWYHVVPPTMDWWKQMCSWVKLTAFWITHEM